MDSIPGLGRSPEGVHGIRLYYSCLENPMDREAWQFIVHRIKKTQIWLKQFSRHPWAVAHQALLFMRFPRQEYCSELPFYSLGDLPDQRSNPSLLQLAGKFFITGSPDFQALINNWKKKKRHTWWWINYKTQVLFDWVILKIRYLGSSEKQWEGGIQNLDWNFLKFCFKKLLNLCKSRRYSKSPGNPSIGDLAPTIINILSCYFIPLWNGHWRMSSF